MNGFWKETAKKAKAQGWIIEVRRNSHLVWISPKGVKVWSSQTPKHQGSKQAHEKMMRNTGEYD